MICVQITVQPFYFKSNLKNIVTQIQNMKKILNTILLLTLALHSFSQFQTFGCTDINASNYSASATINDGSCCYSEFYLTASATGFGDLYIESADGSFYDYLSFPTTQFVCLTGGCITLDAMNYGSSPLVIVLETSTGIIDTLVIESNAPYYGSLSFGESVSGCTDPSACNYNPNATCPGECSYECYGCTDPNALNYDNNATLELGTCCYDSNNLYTVLADGPIVVSASNVFTGEYNFAIYPQSPAFCMSATCFNVNVFGNGPGEINYQIFSPQGNIVAEGTVNQTEGDFTSVSLGDPTGCGDPNACNYDPEVTCLDYESCDYSCFGCTDASAVNFNPNATIDDGSCCDSDSWATLSTDFSGYFYVYSYVNGVHHNLYLNGGQSQNICLPNGCYYLEVYSDSLGFDFEPGNLTITLNNGEELFNQTIENYFFVGEFSYNAISGCGDPSACNYDPSVTCSNYLDCNYDCYGCTNPDAQNFNPEATIDNGSCCLYTYTLITSEPVYWTLVGSQGYSYNYGYTDAGESQLCINDGCYHLSLSTYGLTIDSLFGGFTTLEYAVIDNLGNIVVEGSTNESWYINTDFSVNAIEGCMDSYACNYNPTANCWNQALCTYDCYGCTDPTAVNFDESAQFDNGSCCFNNYYLVETSDNVYWNAYSLDGSGYYSGGNYPQTNGFCMDNGCFGISFYSYLNLPFTYTIYAPDGSVFAQGEEFIDGYVEEIFGQNETIGCADQNACNFDPNADCGYYWLCDYSCYGCTDENAPNYNPQATIDNGSCCTNSWFTIEFNGPAFWVVYNASTGLYQTGSYPETNGFCNSGECVTFQAYSYSGELLQYSVMDELGQVVEAGSAGEFGFVNIPLSFSNNDIAGCTDPTACNFNPAATCNPGNCEYYCGGCTDPQAINYDSFAAFEDGSCFYEIEPPMFVIQTEDDLTQEQYFVRADVMSLGNGAPYILSNDFNTEMMMVDENGQYWIGPIPCGQDVVLSVNSAVYGMTQYMISDPLSGGCGIILNAEENNEAVNLYSVFPNPSNGIINLSGPASEKTTIRVMDMTGRIVFEKFYDQITGNMEFDLQNLSNGYYQVQIIQLNRSENLPLIIKK